MELAEELFKDLREEDVLEVSTPGDDVLDVIRRSILVSELLYTKRDTSDKLLCVYGLASFPSIPYKVVWMLGTKHLETCPKKIDILCRQAKTCLKEWVKEYGPLTNMVYVESKKSIRWLSWLGVTWLNPIEYKGRKFIPFVYGGEQ